MSAMDALVPSLTQRCSLTLEKKRERKSMEEHLGMWTESELGILPLEHSAAPPQNSRGLAGSRVYQPTSEKSMLQETSQGDQRAVQMATS